ncbi:ornithine decarboxylase antizyme 3 [Podarcis lilfordi]|uniref:Ornithine decarboxylase antizyme 3 n=1 Tax=Podarcis lilfordi TaxID=74358 RepID=A0AA35LLN6_9SAUR|nr:ornithine decarboxylase antizyme 3 [Podarcis lilfordi]
MGQKLTQVTIGVPRVLKAGALPPRTHFARGREALPSKTRRNRAPTNTLSWTKNCLYPLSFSSPSFCAISKRRLRYRRKMTPSGKSSTLTQHRRRSLEGDQASLKEVYKAGNLTVFAGERQRPDQPVQLDFHFARGSQGVSHWHGLLQARTVFLDTPHLALDCNSRESLTATLEYVEENTEADQVLVNFHKTRRDRGDLLRAFGFLGFTLLRPDHPSLPPWEDVIFMAYPMERELCQAEEDEKWRTRKPDPSGRQDGAVLGGQAP